MHARTGLRGIGHARAEIPRGARFGYSPWASARRLRSTRKLFQIKSPKTTGIIITTPSIIMML